MQNYTYTVVLEPAAEGGFTAFCPSLPGVVSEGDTVEETLEMVRDAIAGYLESLRKDGLAIPQERGAIISPVTIELPSAA
jgi:predicted RNase H-like HicB family nuclease